MRRPETLALCLLLLLCAPARAHKPSDSYLRILGGEQRLAVKWDIALKDLEYLIGLDADQNGEITWGELKAKEREIAAHALSRLRLAADGEDCVLRLERLLFTTHSDGGYAVLVLTSDRSGHPATLEIEYRLLFDVDPTHRGLVLYDGGSAASTDVLTPASPKLTLQTGEAHLAASFAAFTAEGVWHIWIGFDHILFLLSLLLPAAMTLQGGRWRPVPSFAPAFQAVLKIVTVFTITHSITLWLAVMDYVTIPSRTVESIIAASIIVTALNNVWPVLPLSGSTIAFLFGLVHGLGFANVLLDLGLPPSMLAVSLLGFNVGVELGQLAIVLLVFPAIYLLRATSFYRLIVLRAGSLLIAVIASIWMYERVFNANVIAF